MLVSTEMHRAKGSGLAPWPARLTVPPPRLADFDYSAEMFEKDTVNYFLYHFFSFSTPDICILSFIRKRAHEQVLKVTVKTGVKFEI